MKAWWRAAAQAVYAVSIAHVAVNHVAFTTLLQGPSMMPTFQAKGDVAIVERISASLNRIAVGDVVIVVCPDDPKVMVCKRVMATQGHHITVHRGPWRIPSTVHVQVPDGHVWLQGDNLRESRDSRTYGPVPAALIKGRVVLQIWPPSRAKVVGRQVPNTVYNK